MSNHVLIAGTGRAGTSLLVRVFEACGLQTELSTARETAFWDKRANAGLETIPYPGSDCPYVIKSPWSYQFIEEFLRRSDIKIDAVCIPVRDLKEAASSRIVLELQDRYAHNAPDLNLGVTFNDWGTVPGGATYSLEPLDQARILAYSFHRMMEVLIRYEIPVKLLAFPRFVSDPGYLYRCLGEIVQTRLSEETFIDRVKKILDPSLVRMGGDKAKGVDEKVGSSSHDAVLLDDFKTLDRLALKRELKMKIDAQLVSEQARTELADKVRELTETCDLLTAKCSVLSARCQELDSKARRRTVRGRVRQFKEIATHPFQ